MGCPILFHFAKNTYQYTHEELPPSSQSEKQILFRVQIHTFRKYQGVDQYVTSHRPEYAKKAHNSSSPPYNQNALKHKNERFKRNSKKTS